MKVFKVGQRIIYYQDGDIHYTTDTEWDVYIHVRKSTPKLVRIFSLQREMKDELFRREECRR